MEPEVSIIIPIYNVEKYLNKAVDSVLNQTIINIEVILVDDGSTDKSIEIVDEYVKRDARVKAIHQKNQGVSAARNAGLNLAKGEYIGFVDPDDWVEATMFEKLRAEAKTSNCDVVMCSFVLEDTEGKLLKNQEHPFENNFLMEREDIVDKVCKKLLISGFFTSVCDKIYLRDFLEQSKIQFFTDVSLREDYFFNIDIFHYSKRMMYLATPFYHYQDNPDSTLKRYHKNSFEIAVRLYKYKIEYSRRWGLNTREINYRMAYDFLDYVQDSVIQIFSYKNPDDFIKKIKKIFYIVNNEAVEESLQYYKHENFTNKKNKIIKLKIGLINSKSVLLLFLISIVANNSPKRFKEVIKLVYKE